jgi:DNA (cytosine-5)-methyltransferase 1
MVTQRAVQGSLVFDEVPSTESQEIECGAPERYSLRGGESVRLVSTRDGRAIESRITLAEAGGSMDARSAFDHAWLRSRAKPGTLRGAKSVRIADLFCGAGGMSVGIDEAVRALGMRTEHVLASDIESEALSTYVRNFGPAIWDCKPIQESLDGALGDELTPAEKAFRHKVGHIDLVVGGPPCQGHSDLNNHTRRNDPKNDLYDRMARFAEVVRPTHLVIENVPGVRHDRGGVFHRTIEALKTLGYRVDSAKLHTERIGVPQRRHRAVVVASREIGIHQGFLETLERRYSVPKRSVQWAIDDLLGALSGNPIDQVTAVSKLSQSRIDWMWENGQYDLPDEFRPDCHRTKRHTYKSVYGRLYWDQPSWTITTGFQVMGQGRFLHPVEKRVITSHEAARLQFFPDFFDFGMTNRKGYAKMIGNAVPSKLAYVLALELFR